MGEHRKENVLVISWTGLPDKWKEYVKDRLDYRFHNDTLAMWYSEYEPCEENTTWAESLTLETIESYFLDQSETNGFMGSREDFIKDYSLEFEIWIMENFDLTGVQKILIEIGW